MAVVGNEPPFDQLLPIDEEEMRVSEYPVQRMLSPVEVEMLGVGFGFTVTLVVPEVPEQPFASVTVTK